MKSTLEVGLVEPPKNLEDAEARVSLYGGEPNPEAGDVVIIDGFQVVKSNRILCRTVVNDAVVGPWSKLEYTKANTMDGLHEWIRRAGSHWDPELLGGPGLFDSHLVDYGLRLQFWVPTDEEAISGGAGVVCIDVEGVEEFMTEGTAYELVGRADGLYVVVCDDGERREFDPDRFEETLRFEVLKSRGGAGVQKYKMTGGW